jgi:hypothetical protein
MCYQPLLKVSNLFLLRFDLGYTRPPAATASNYLVTTAVIQMQKINVQSYTGTKSWLQNSSSTDGCLQILGFKNPYSSSR